MHFVCINNENNYTMQILEIFTGHNDFLISTILEIHE